MANQKSYHLRGITNRKQEILRKITQPLTATQLSLKLDISRKKCRVALASLKSYGLITCLNPNAPSNLLYWITQDGKQCLKQLQVETSESFDFPDIDWNLYASVCFSQRSAVIRTLMYAMQPAKIKRRAKLHYPNLRMSSNNTRDVICFLKTHNIVRPVPLRKKAHPGYELTELGLHMRRLLNLAEVRI